MFVCLCVVYAFHSICSLAGKVPRVLRHYIISLIYTVQIAKYHGNVMYVKVR